MFIKTPAVALLAALAVTTALTPVAALAREPAAATAAAFSPQVVDPSKGVDFAQDHSDIKADPAVRFGKLPNGMTYAILKNATPPGTASIRLRVNGGSLNEHDDQQGLAHFLEHMAFNGSKNVAEGDMIKILERHGLAFGPDTNASTNFGQTLYELDLPKVSDDDLDTGLFLMRETAGNLTLDDGAIDRERGVILGEERARDTPDLHSYMKWSADAFPGQLYPVRLPIGKTDIINTAKHAQFADFYTNFYRPEQVTLIVVGDFDPTAMEAKIKAKFSDWTPAAGAIRVTDYGAYKPKGLTADTYTESGLADSITATWFAPIDNHYQDVGKETADFTDDVRFDILNDRLERAAKAADAPFVSAGVGQGDIDHTAHVVQLNITPKPGMDKAAFAAAMTIVRQYALYGATQPELDRVLTNDDAGFKAALQGANTRNSRGLAEGIVSSVDNDEVFTSPQQDYDYFTALKPSLTLDVINSGTKALFGGDGPFLWHEAEGMGDLDKQAMLDTYKTVQSANLTAMATTDTKPWPYTDFGAPQKPVRRVEVKDLGLVQLTWANGVTATIKTTDFKADEIGVNVRFAGGLESLAPGSHPPVYQAQLDDIKEGGLGQLTGQEIKDSLAGKIYDVNFGIGEDSSALSGSTTKADFATQMQVLMAFTTDAAYRADAFDRLKGAIPDYYAQLGASPDGVFQMNGSAILHSGDPRFGMPSQADFLATPNDAVKSLIDGQIKTGPIEITIVGDVDEATAEAELDKTFGTLPARKPAAKIPAANLAVRFPTTDLHPVLTHGGRADQDLSFIAWPGADFTSDTRRARALTILAEVLTLRLTDVVREKLGIAYSPFAGNNYSQVFPGYGYLSAAAEVKPENDQAFYDAVSGIVADLKTNPISADELLRAQKPVLDKMDTDLKTNTYWAGALPGSISDPKKLDYIRTRRDQYQAVTAADIQKLANEYLDMAKALRIQVKPSDQAAAQGATSKQ